MALAWLGGPGNAFDRAAIETLTAARLAYPTLTRAGIWITFAGGAPMTLLLALLGATFLVWRGRLGHASALLAIVLGGRLMVELLKQLIGRPRPDLDYPVMVQSLSFPSGHAANSMIAFVAVALFCTPERHRKAAMTVAIGASLVVGATRPLLGVHWPSDALSGWIFGLLWVIGGWRIALRFGSAGRV